jgi:hypothetical protein
MELTARIAVELHEDQVPELQEAIAIAPNLAVGSTTTYGFSLIDHNLRAGSARARIAHGPEIVLLPQPDDAILGDNLSPEVEGFVIVEIDRDPHLILGQTPLMDQKIPSHLDGPFFEIISKGEVSQHLKEGMVSGRLPHILQIVVFSSSSNALLGGNGPFVIASLFGQKDTLELNHSSVGKKEGRIFLGNQRGAGDDAMPSLCKVCEKGFSDFV